MGAPTPENLFSEILPRFCFVILDDSFEKDVEGIVDVISSSCFTKLGASNATENLQELMPEEQLLG